MDLYHGTDEKFNVGDFLVPRASFIQGRGEKVERVFATSDLDWAENFGIRQVCSCYRNKINGANGIFSMILSDGNPVPISFSVARNKKYYVYRLKADGFRLSNPDSKSSIMEHVSESPAEILEVAREGTLKEWLGRGNKIYVAPDSIMQVQVPGEKSFGEALKHAVPYRDWSGGRD
jgi:hypothetical protein